MSGGSDGGDRSGALTSDKSVTSVEVVSNSSEAPVEHLDKFSGTSVEHVANGLAPWFGVEQDGPGRLRLHGELDLAAVPEMRTRLDALEGDVAVDCRALTFIDVAGLRALVAAHRSGDARGAKLSIVNPAPCLVRLLGLTGFDKELDVCSEGSVP